MDIYMILIRLSNGLFSMDEAWDAQRVNDNPSEWTAFVAETVTLHGEKNVRVLKTSVDMDAIRKAFEPITIPILGMEAL